MRDDAIAKLKQNLRGAVIERSDPNYDEARALHNGMIEKRPRKLKAITAFLNLFSLRVPRFGILSGCLEAFSL
jgi:hypothetical protein